MTASFVCGWEGMALVTTNGRTDPFSKLSKDEQLHYGPAEEWDIRGFVGPKVKAGERAQFSLRVPLGEYEALRNLARSQGVTFSDVVREAIDRYVNAQPRLTNVVLRISTKDVGPIYTSNG